MNNQPTSSNNNAVATSGGGFQTSGQIDWTAMASSNLQFAINVLERTSHGGIEPVTLAAGYSLSSRLVLGELASKKVSHAVMGLKAFSPLHSALWLGFGVKHIIRRLVETRQGLSLVALVGCMSECYSVPICAEIFEGLFDLMDTTSSLTPSRDQWMKLVRACAGGLASSSFGLVLLEMTTSYFNPGVGHATGTAHVKAISGALFEILDLHKEPSGRIHLVGGPDCGWLGAVAHWLLDFTIETRKSSGEPLVFLGSHAPGNRTVRLTYEENATLCHRIRVEERCYVVPNGEAIVHWSELAGAGVGEVAGHYGRLPWSKALASTFGASIEDLLHGPLTKLCGTALASALQLLATLGTRPQLSEAQRAISGCELSYGEGFLFTAQEWLPEIAQAPALIEAVKDAMTRTHPIDFNTSLVQLAEACNCNLCTSALAEHPQRDLSDRFRRCKAGITAFLCVIIVRLSRLAVESSLFPTRAGLGVPVSQMCVEDLSGVSLRSWLAECRRRQALGNLL